MRVPAYQGGATRLSDEYEETIGSGHIVIKINSLTDRTIINALYKASNAGVQIDLIVRGIRMLRPGVPNLSDNIRVTSIVGRFLEHSRVFYFKNDGDEQVFIGSPDMMSRNLKRRVEIICPIHDRRIRNAIINKILPAFIHDTAKGHVLQANGKYLPPEHPGSGNGSQETFITHEKDLVVI